MKHPDEIRNDPNYKPGTDPELSELTERLYTLLYSLEKRIEAPATKKPKAKPKAKENKVIDLAEYRKNKNK